MPHNLTDPRFDSTRPDDPATLDALAAWRSELALAGSAPWLASLVMRRLGALRRRLEEIGARLAVLPRRMRRALARRWALAWAVSLPAATLLLALAAGSAQAATITVDPSGTGCTLSAAITNANNGDQSGSASCAAGGPGADTINFAAANGSYLLNTNYGAALPVITAAVTIQGNGNTTLDAEDMFRVLTVSTGGSLALANATITGGSASLGAGVYARSSTLRVVSSTITGSSAVGGGGIFARESTVNVVSSTITGNSARLNGGGVAAVESTVNVESSTISGNSTVTTYGFGGGIYAFNSSLDVVGSTITGNSAGSGGGIFTSTGSMSLQDTTVSGNSAYGAGGGLFDDNSTTVNLQDATISSNSAGSGGGGGLYLDSQTATLQDVSISGNSTDYVGGGIYAGDDISMSLRNTTISGNTAAEIGGGMKVTAHSTVDLTNATVSGNSAEYAGGIYSYYSSVNLSHATITANSAGGFGGGISSIASQINVASSIVAAQSAGADCFGTVSSLGYNIESATSCTFTDTGDQQNVSGAQLNLGPLALNAPGTTVTRALGAGSFALDKITFGTNGCGTTITDDQRGIARPQPAGGSCDVGAYEFQIAAPTAAQITRFTAAPDATGRVWIEWETASELGVAAFRVERAAAAGASSGPIGPWTGVRMPIPARGGTAGGDRYVIGDSPGVGSFAYRLVVVDAAGPSTTHGPAGVVVRALRAFLPFAFAR